MPTYERVSTDIDVKSGKRKKYIISCGKCGRKLTTAMYSEDGTLRSNIDRFVQKERCYFCKTINIYCSLYSWETLASIKEEK